MIEIINKNPNRKFKTNCHCGCEFTFQGEDITIERETIRFTLDPLANIKLKIIRYIICPCCKEYLNLETWHYEEVKENENN